MIFRKIFSMRPFRKGKGVDTYRDRPLNFDLDQASNIRSRLRRLNVEQGLSILSASAPIVLVGTGLALMATRRFKLGSVVVMGVLLQKVLRSRGLPVGLPVRSLNDIEFEKYALKVERGDFGKLEVIPFR